MRVLLIIAVIFAAAAASPLAMGQSTLDNPVGEDHPIGRDTGFKSNLGDSPELVHQEIVRIKNAGWVRLHFGPETTLGRNSYLRVTSLLDNHEQELDLGALGEWSNSTAYFNGDAVLIEMVAGPKTTQNRLVIERAAVEVGVFHEIGICGLCGVDNRVQSDEEWSGRLLPAGCTASVWNPESCLVSAGHCISGGSIIQFNVPNSAPNCSLNHPGPQEQFPITAFDFFNGGPGQDWAVMTSGTNSVGQSIYGRYGVFRPIATAPPGLGNPVSIWGYGVSATCIVSQTQQTSNGSINGVSGLLMNHSVDATGGNSGSALIRAGEILGIATHCPCPNIATRIDHPFFRAAREELCTAATGACCLSDGACVTKTFSQCADLGGKYLGDEFPCEPNECQAPEGACCLGGGVCVIAEQSFCELAGGVYEGDDVPCEDACSGGECPADVDGDGEVGFSDLLDVLSNWGPCPGCAADVDGDDEVGFGDLLEVLSAWGPCP